MKKQLHSHPRKYGKDSRGCRVTGSCQGLIRKYGINMSRRTFREQAELIGFQKLRWTSWGSDMLPRVREPLSDVVKEIEDENKLCHYSFLCKNCECELLSKAAYDDSQNRLRLWASLAKLERSALHSFMDFGLLQSQESLRPWRGGAQVSSAAACDPDETFSFNAQVLSHVRTRKAGDAKPEQGAVAQRETPCWATRQDGFVPTQSLAPAFCFHFE